MLFSSKDNTEAQLQQMWGSFVPSLTTEQMHLAVEVWQKIKVRKQQNHKSDLQSAALDS